MLVGWQQEIKLKKNFCWKTKRLVADKNFKKEKKRLWRDSITRNATGCFSCIHQLPLHRSNICGSSSSKPAKVTATGSYEGMLENRFGLYLKTEEEWVTPGWLRDLSVRLLISAQVRISGWWDQALCSVGNLLLSSVSLWPPSPLPLICVFSRSHSLSLKSVNQSINQSLRKKKKTGETDQLVICCNWIFFFI